MKASQSVREEKTAVREMLPASVCVLCHALRVCVQAARAVRVAQCAPNWPPSLGSAEESLRASAARPTQEAARDK